MSFDVKLTFNTVGNQFTNINCWSCDGIWLVYDIIPYGSSFTGLTIERIHLKNRKTEVIYRATAGAHVGVVACSPQEPQRYVFIHGPENPDSEWQYGFHHRRGTIVADRQRACSSGG